MSRVNEIIICEKDFANETQLCAYIAGKLDGLTAGAAGGALGGAAAGAVDGAVDGAIDGGFESEFEGGLGELVARLTGISSPTRIVLRHDALDDPVAEAMGLEAISNASRGQERQLDWFDVACAMLEKAGSYIENLDVIVYFDDLDEDEPNEAIGNVVVSARAAISRLKRGNLDYLASRKDDRNISNARIRELFEGGQQPYAVVITCSDSRVVPEHIFMAGLGELFVIRVAGNIVGEVELASAIYACDHLHTKLLLVLGHTHCGAIESAMAGENHGPVAAITSHIAEIIADERDPYVVSVLNARAAIAELAANAELAALVEREGLEIHGAIYHTHSGVVDFLDA